MTTEKNRISSDVASVSHPIRAGVPDDMLLSNM